MTNTSGRAHPDDHAQLAEIDSGSTLTFALGDPRLPSRFWSKVSPTPSGCWIWTGAKSTGGYAAFLFDSKRAPGKPRGARDAHRRVYLIARGPIADGLHLDHLCRNRACVNPAHLEPVTIRENILRGVGVSAQNAAKTWCKNGHAFNETNTKLSRGRSGRTRRECIACTQLRSLARIRARRTA